MKYTNVYNLPPAVVRALTLDDYEPRGDISVTGLIKPPRMKQLEERFDHLLVEDVSERVWLLLGKSIHVVLERSSVSKAFIGSALVEAQVEAVIDGWTVTGTADILEGKTLYDYKVSSVWSVIFGLKPEWEAQLNAYRYLLPVTVDDMAVLCIMRDHQKSKAQADPEYPQIPVAVMPVPVWPDDVALSWLKDRVAMHKRARTTADTELPFCTADERWARPSTWAVMKKGRKSAMRVLPTRDEAEAWLEAKGGDTVVERPGASVRCESYCIVKKFCNQYNEGAI